VTKNQTLKPFNFNGSTKEIKVGSVKPKAMTQVINQLLIQPHTSASLVQTIGVYSASYINHCLGQLKKAGLIGAVKDPKKHTIFYYNIGLDAVKHRDEN
jgi:hypothetical protein